MIGGIISDLITGNPNKGYKSLEERKAKDDKERIDYANTKVTKPNNQTLDESKVSMDSKLNDESKKSERTFGTPQGKIKTTTTEGQLYFVALKSLDRLHIQFVPDLDITRKTDISDIKIVGRNIPQYQYLGGETTLDLKLDFHSMDEDRMDVINKCRWLEHLAHNDGYKKPPEQVKLIFGELFKEQIWIVKDVKYKLSGFNRSKGFLPQQAYADVTLALDLSSNPTWTDVRSDGGLNQLGF